MTSMTSAELKKLEDDRDWWKRACATFRGRLAGWTYRYTAVVFFDNDGIQLDGRVATAINLLLTKSSRNHERRSALIAARNELMRLHAAHFKQFEGKVGEPDLEIVEKLNKAIRYEDDLK